MNIAKHINLKGDLFATAIAFAGQAMIRLGSSLILTRIVRPEAYGLITIMMSIIFVIEMLADIGVTVFIIRDKNGEEPRYVNTAWTMRFGRAVLNTVALFVCAPVIADSLYHTPELATPLRVFSLFFLICGFESMSFPIAIRRKRSRIIMYSELAAGFLSGIFTVLFCYYSRDVWGMIYGILFNRVLITIITHLYYPELRPKLQFDYSAAREILALTKFTMPSSMLTLALSQYDKVIFLRLFDLHLLGVYGLAGNIVAPIESLVSKISQMVLYPRCSHNFRANRSTFVQKYYTENTKLFVSILFVPAAVGGAARFLVALLYDPRYSQAGAILQALMLRAVLLSLASPAEDLLIAAGESHVVLVGNVFRAIWMVAASLAGYYFLGFMGFVYGAALSGLPPLIYYLWLQRKKGMLMAKYETYKIAFTTGVAISAYFASSVLLAWWPWMRIRV
jgi:lipopolysaccharide exporter